MLTPLQILNKVREAKASRTRPPASAATTTPLGSLGAPPHLTPGQKVVDPETGLEGEVISYGRTPEPAPLPGTQGR